MRLIENLQASARVEIQDASGRPVKAYKGDSNHCYEIWHMTDGKAKARVITTFEAHGDSLRRPNPAAKRLLRVFKRDMVAIELEGERLICYVQKFDPANGLFLAPHLEENADARNRDKSDPFRLRQMGTGPAIKAKIRRVYVDELGRIRDQGPASR